MEFSYDLYLAVIVANISGYMEENDLIDVPDDEDLTRTICEIVNEYNECDYGNTINMFDFAIERLLRRYGI
jgi:hypothetical protein